MQIRCRISPDTEQYEDAMSQTVFSGRIVKALSGFYYVETENGISECRARGRLRGGMPPLVGDYVRFSLSAGKGMIEEICEESNRFIRPPAANIDVLVLIISSAVPAADTFVVDRVTAIAGIQNVPVLIVVNKTDLDCGEKLCGIYSRAGFPVISASAETGEGIDELKRAVYGKTAVFTGNSGVGKSSLLNRICPELQLRTGEISEKLGRGKHTTRHVELFKTDKNTYIGDTPGFSAFDLEEMDVSLKNRLPDAFPDFAPYACSCRFPDCVHIREPDCSVKQALAEGKIEKTRYQSYVQLYEAAKNIKAWANGKT